MFRSCCNYTVPIFLDLSCSVMPAKATIYNLKCDPVFDFGTGPRNAAYYNPQGNNILSHTGSGLISFVYETIFFVSFYLCV